MSDPLRTLRPNRRAILGCGAAALCVAGAWPMAAAEPRALPDLALVRDGRVQRVGVRRLPSGALVPQEPDAFDWLLRDPEGESVTRMDGALAGMLLDLQTALRGLAGQDLALEVVSGHVARPERHPGTARDDALSQALHRAGRAVDLRAPVASRAALRRVLADSPSAGGVGMLLGSGLIHLDTGDWRRWARPLA